MATEQFDLIETPRLRLRRTPKPPSAGSGNAPSDAWIRALDFFATERSDPQTIRWSLQGKVDESRSATEAWMRKQAEKPWSYVVELLDGRALGANAPTNPQAVVGGVGINMPAFKTAEYKSTEPEIGYFFSKQVRGHGFAPEACQALMDAFWRHEDLLAQEGRGGRWTCIEGETDTENYPSVRVMEKLGFRKVRVLEKSYESDLLGGWRDLVIYRLDRHLSVPSQPIG